MFIQDSTTYSPPHNFINVPLGYNLQRYKAFICNRKRRSTVNKHCRSGHASAVKQATARPGYSKIVNLTASFSCALENKGIEK